LAIVAAVTIALTGCAYVARITPNPGADGPGAIDTNLSPTEFAMTPDGRFIAFAGLANYTPNNGPMSVYVRDLSTRVTTRVSVPLDRFPLGGSNGSWAPAISDDGRYVAFVSDVSNLVPNDTNSRIDVFVRDRLLGTTVRANVGSGGAQSSLGAAAPAISGNGRYVAFRSEGNDLVADDTNNVSDVFVHDLVSGSTERVSVATDGSQANLGSFGTFALNADGRFVTFASGATNFGANDTNGNDDIFLRDRQAGTTQYVSVTPTGRPGNSGSLQPGITTDGRYVVFGSGSTDLVAADTNGVVDVFVRDLQTSVTRLVSLTSSGGQIAGGTNMADDPVISPDGNRIAFTSDATNVVPNDTNGQIDVFVRDLRTDTTVRADVTKAGQQSNARSFALRVANGIGLVGFISLADNLDPDDHDQWADVFVRSDDGNLQAASRKTTGIPNAPQHDPVLDGDGRVLGFVTDATNLVTVDNPPSSVMARDLSTSINELVSVPDQPLGPRTGSSPAISADGHLIAFSTEDALSGLDNNFEADIYVRDRNAHTSELTSVASNSAVSNGMSRLPSISDDGRDVAFLSVGTNLVTGDTNGIEDAFVHDRVTGVTTRVDLSTASAQADAPVLGARISGDGSAVAFWTAADNMVAGDTNNSVDVFVRDLIANTTTRVSVDGNGLQATGSSRNAVIDHAGDLVAFESDAPNLVASDSNSTTDIFVKDRSSGILRLVSASPGGANGPSSHPTISESGSEIAFQSDATNLVPGDTNGVGDVFTSDLPTQTIQRANATNGAQPDGKSSLPALSGDGKYVAFETDADNLLGGDVNAVSDIVVHATRVPTATNPSPVSIARGTSMLVTVHGVGFAPNLQLTTFAQGVQISGVAIINATMLTATITAGSNATVGSAPLLLFNPGNAWKPSSGAGGVCFTCVAIS
jgi:Tol biopolymer transport system component